MLYAGTYQGTIHTYCADFNYTDPITFTINANGVIDLPSSSQGILRDGAIDSAGHISGISITVRSLSAGDITIPYLATDDGISFNGSGTSFNGITSTIQATISIGPSTPADPKALFGDVTHDAHSPGGQVYALYDGLLGRAPDTGGLEYWADQFADGVSPTVLAAGFLASAEGQARSGAADPGTFVTQLYNATLHRGPDDGGLSYWKGQLAAGMSRAEVGVGFALSDEHLGNIKGALDAGVFVPDADVAQAARLYYTVLDRAPDVGGLKYWANLIKTGAATLDTETATFLATPEVQGKTASLSTRDYVSMVYDNALGRAPDDGGLDYWVHSIDVDHQSRVAVTTTIGQSPEAQSHLAPAIELGWHLA